ncbi:MAG: hotdog domain-containing protein [Candidatus Nanopelagicales bacterium]|nr:hotdog domain-containing protein [Candidatus Nanopelagicales bacterium]
MTLPLSFGDSAWPPESGLTMDSTTNRAVVVRVVGPADTAESLGSGDVAVLATPRLIAWAEAATVLAAGPLLAPGQTSVGVAIDVKHLAASPVGAQVEVCAVVSASSGSRIDFDVTAHNCQPDGMNRQVLSGRVSRAVVDRGDFQTRFAKPL